VKGRGRFPLDQLRRYEMFPTTPEAAQAIEDSFGSYSEKRLPGWLHETREIDLGMYASSLGADGPCIERFRSFGWSAWTVEIWKEVDGDDELFWTNAGGYERERQYAEAYGDVS
jgi:hypothetical protein